MAPKELIELQLRQPFTGLRVHLSDGKSYEVLHPERMIVTRSLVHIALTPVPEDDVPERAVYCDPIHIVRVEPITDGRSRQPSHSN